MFIWLQLSNEESNFNQLDEQEWLFMLKKSQYTPNKSEQVSKYMTAMFFSSFLAVRLPHAKL